MPPLANPLKYSGPPPTWRTANRALSFLDEESWPTIQEQRESIPDDLPVILSCSAHPKYWAFEPSRLRKICIIDPPPKPKKVWAKSPHYAERVVLETVGSRCGIDYPPQPPKPAPLTGAETVAEFLAQQLPCWLREWLETKTAEIASALDRGESFVAEVNGKKITIAPPPE